MVSTLALMALAVVAMQRPGWMGDDLLFDCRLAPAAGPAGSMPTDARPHRYVLFLRGNRPEDFGDEGDEDSGDEEDYVPALDVHDPDDLLPFSPGMSIFGLSYAWPDLISIGIPAYDGIGPHQERFPPRGFGGIFRPIRVDHIAGTAQVVLIQHSAWYGPRGEVPPSSHYSGHCRLVRGDPAYRTFQDIDR
jgi:hypothetical protein